MSGSGDGMGGGGSKSELEQCWDELDGPASRQVTAIIVGCGQRGQNYAAFARDFPSRFRVVAVAEPLRHRRRTMETLYSIAEDRSVEDWRLLAAAGSRIADAAIICTQDKDHKVTLDA